MENGTTVETAKSYLQTMPTQVLLAAARGDLNIEDMIKREIANRGLDRDGKWAGFKKAAQQWLGNN